MKWFCILSAIFLFACTRADYTPQAGAWYERVQDGKRVKVDRIASGFELRRYAYMIADTLNAIMERANKPTRFEVSYDVADSTEECFLITDERTYRIEPIKRLGTNYRHLETGE
jgi:hypothetical protein